MRHASYVATGLSALSSATDLDASKSASYDQKTKRKSIFAVILAALHHSRRLQAQRVLRQYQHLIADPENSDLTSSSSKPGDL